MDAGPEDVHITQLADCNVAMQGPQHLVCSIVYGKVWLASVRLIWGRGMRAGMLACCCASSVTACGSVHSRSPRQAAAEAAAHLEGHLGVCSLQGEVELLVPLGAPPSTRCTSHSQQEPEVSQCDNPLSCIYIDVSISLIHGCAACVLMHAAAERRAGGRGRLLMHRCPGNGAWSLQVEALWLVAASEACCTGLTAAELRLLGATAHVYLAVGLHVTEEGVDAQVQGAFDCVVEARRSAAETQGPTGQVVDG